MSQTQQTETLVMEEKGDDRHRQVHKTFIQKNKIISIRSEAPKGRIGCVRRGSLCRTCYCAHQIKPLIRRGLRNLWLTVTVRGAG